MERHSTYQEKDLLKQVAAGNEPAYRVLFEKYWDRIYSTAFAFTKSVEQSRDLAQDVFARIWIKREGLAGVENFEAYLFTTARNTVRNSLRTTAYTKANARFYEIYFTQGSNTPEDSLDLKELKNLVDQGISSLPSQQQKAFRLSRFQGLNLEEIGREMGLTTATAKSHLVRAIASLRKYLDEHADTAMVIFWIFLFLH